MKKLIVFLLAVLLIGGYFVMPVSAAMSKIPEAGLSLEIPPDFNAYSPYSTDEEFANLWGLSREDSIARMEETGYRLILRSPEHSVTMYFSVENTSETNFFLDDRGGISQSGGRFPDAEQNDHRRSCGYWRDCNRRFPLGLWCI